MAAFVERHGDRCQSGHLRNDRISVERRMAQRNPIAGPRQRMQNLHRHARRPRTQHDLPVIDPDVASDEGSQLLGQEFRIPVGGIDGADQCRTNSR